MTTFLSLLCLAKNVWKVAFVQVESEDTLATIIDFSLSRAEVEGKLIFNNLAEDPAVFQVSDQMQIFFCIIFFPGEGCWPGRRLPVWHLPINEATQSGFSLDANFLSSATVTSKSASFKDSWAAFRPRSNVLWLHYLLTKVHQTKIFFHLSPLPFLPISYNRWPLRGRCITQARLKRHPSFTNQARYETFFNYPDVKMYFLGLSRMNALKKRLLEFSSAAEWVKREGERVDDMWNSNMVRLDKDKWKWWTMCEHDDVSLEHSQCGQFCHSLASGQSEGGGTLACRLAKTFPVIYL